MAGVLPPGLGNDQQATQATAFIRQQPWYLQWLQAQHITPGAGDQVKLNDTQRAQLMALAVKNGIGFNDKYDMIDENGQIAEEHHKLKKIAIAAALAGLAVTGLGAAGVGPLAGALSASGAAGASTGAAASAGAGAGAGSSAAAGLSAGLAGAGAGVGTGAGVAATTAGVSSWLAPALKIGLPVAGQLVGAGLQASAANNAAEIQGKGLQDALDFEKAQYGDLTKRLDPYVQAGGASSDRMAQLLGLPARAGTTATAPPARGPAVGAYVPPDARTALGTPPQTAGTPAPGQASPDALVMLQAPDGSTKQVPQSAVPFYLSKGAKQVAA